MGDERGDQGVLRAELGLHVATRGEEALLGPVEVVALPRDDPQVGQRPRVLHRVRSALDRARLLQEATRLVEVAVHQLQHPEVVEVEPAEIGHLAEARCEGRCEGAVGSGPVGVPQSLAPDIEAAEERLRCDPIRVRLERRCDRAAQRSLGLLRLEAFDRDRADP